MLGVFFTLLLVGLVISQALPPKWIKATANIVIVDGNSGNEGKYPSVKLNSSGFAVTSYYANPYYDLRVAVCNDALCTNPTISTVDSAGNVGAHSSLVLNGNGNPVISYVIGFPEDDLKLVVCGNPTCSSGNVITTVDSAGGGMGFTSLALTASGNPVIAYASDAAVKVVLCGNPTCTSGNTYSTIEAIGTSAAYTSLALNGSGNPVISYYSNVNEDLKLVVCGNPACSSSNIITTVDSSTAGVFTSLALNSSGNPVISYYRWLNGVDGNLQIAVCGNPTCTSGNVIITLDSGGDTGHETSLALSSGDLPIVGYLDETNRALKVAACADSTCATKTITLVTVAADGELDPSLILNASGNPVIGFHNYDQAALSLALCANSACTSKTIKNLDTTHDVGMYTSVALTSSGNPVISYYDADPSGLRIAVCGDIFCTAKALTTVDTGSGIVGQYTSVALNANDYPVISYYGEATLKLAVCGDVTCTNNTTITTVDNVGNTGQYTSLKLNSSGNPVISYFDDSTRSVKVVTCGNATCTAGNTVAVIDVNSGSSGNVQTTSLALNGSGFPTIAYAYNAQLKVAVCGNITCTSGNTITDIDFTSGKSLSLRLNASGNPVISYENSGALKVAICGDPACATRNLTSVDIQGDVGWYNSLALNSSGNPIISYADKINGNLKLAVCGNVTCTSGNKVFVADSSIQVGTHNAATINGINGRLFVSYFDGTNLDLKLYTDDLLNLPSTGTPTPTATNTPIRPDTIGVYRNGVFYLRNSNTTGNADITAYFGNGTDERPVAGDWNGDGIDTIGVYRTSTGFFLLSNSNTSPSVAYTVLFGNPGDLPFAGRWTPDMTGDGIGVYRDSNGVLYQRKSLVSGFDDFFAVFGNPGDYGVAGDWDGNGYDSIGIYRSFSQRWYLTNNSTPAGITFSDLDYMWNAPTSPLVVGDWNGDGSTTPGYLTDTGVFVLHLSNGPAGPDMQFAFGPIEGNLPVAGKWFAPNRPVMGVIQPNLTGKFQNIDSNLAD